MRYTFTFGSGQACSCGTPLGNHYTHIHGDDFGDARDRMVSRWGIKWCRQYDSDQAAGVRRFGLTEVETCFDPGRCPCGSKPAPHPIPPGAHDWAKEQPPVCLRDFQPQCYTALGDRLRVQRVGVLWYGEVRSHLSPLWYVVTEHHQSAQACMLATVAALGLAPPEHAHDCTKDHGQAPF